MKFTGLFPDEQELQCCVILHLISILICGPWSILWEKFAGATALS